MSSSLFCSAASNPAGFGPIQVLIVNGLQWIHTDVGNDAGTVEFNPEHQSNIILLGHQGVSEGQLQAGSEILEDKAAIVLVGSTAGKYGEAGHADYAASKSALMYGLTLSLKNEIVKIAPKGRVNCVAPGWVNTPMAAEALKNPRVVYQSLATTPLQKLALLVTLLPKSCRCRPVSGHVTGQVVMVEGGMEGRLLNMPKEFSLH